ncbi:MAG: signal peptidase I [Pseudomonadota bacterium]
MAPKSPTLLSISRWRKRRRLMKEARLLMKETRRILRKYRHRIKDDLADELRKASKGLFEARASQQIGKMQDRMQKLDELLSKHLSFARKSALREYSESIGIAVLIALLLRAFVVEAFKIPSGSMIPTLKVGDHLFVAKYVYGIRIPWTNIKFFDRMPHRGDVVVFIPPNDEGKDYIKRTVAIGGDIVAMRDDVLYLNGRQVKRVRLEGQCQYFDSDERFDNAEMRDCVAFKEEIDGKSFLVLQSPYGTATSFPTRDGVHGCPPGTQLVDSDGQFGCKLPKDCVFFMGDNRDNSQDSRYWGVVHSSHVKGKALFIWLSYGSPDGIRWGRFFDPVHSAPDPKRPDHY